MVDQLFIYRVFAIHIFQQALQFPLIEEIDITISEPIKAFFVEDRASLRQNCKVQRGQRQNLVSFDTIIYIIWLDESILPFLLCLKSS